MSTVHDARGVVGSATTPTRAIGRLRPAVLRHGTRHALRLLRLRATNLLCTRSVLHRDGPVVSLTSYGARIPEVFLVIESIADGLLRPSRLILWLDDEAALSRPPRSLRRLQRRGLEVRRTQNWGPHTKYYPYVAAPAGPSRRPALVTADDDVVYPRSWLAGLAAAAAAEPHLVHCYRARELTFDGEAFAPYGRWPVVQSADASPTHFPLGVSGVLYPAELQEELARRGERFLTCAPKADDVWLHAVAVDLGIPARVVGGWSRLFPLLEKHQHVGLKHANVLASRNDEQIASTYTAHATAVLHGAQDGGDRCGA